MQLASKRNAEGAFLKMVMDDPPEGIKHGAKLLLMVENPASLRNGGSIVDSWWIWSETVPAGLQDWDRWIPVAAPKDPIEAATVAPWLIRALRLEYDRNPSSKPRAIRLVKALARILGGPWAREARTILVSKARCGTSAAGPRPQPPAVGPSIGSGPSEGPRQADAPREPDASTDPCAVCGVRPSPGSKHKLCGGCKAVVYCSKECQAKHWRQGGHKRECSKTHL